MSSGGEGDDGGGNGFDIPDIPGRNNPRGSRSKPNKGSRTARRTKIQARRFSKGVSKLPIGKIALGAVSGAILFEGLTHMEELNSDDLEGEQERGDTQHNDRMQAAQDMANDPNIPNGDARKIEAKKVLSDAEKLKSDTKKYGEDEAILKAEARQRIEENLRLRKEQKDEVHRLKSHSKILPQTENKAFLPGPQSDLVIPDELKNLKDDTSKMSQTDETGKMLIPVAAEAPKLLNNVTEQKQELADNKAAPAPITVINNNTNNVGGGGGQSMSFASASAVNLDTAINDFFRSHGRIFA